MTTVSPAIPSRGARAAGGFTLGEVLIATLIISFGILALIGILPNAMATLGQSAELSAEARITQHIQRLYAAAFDAARTDSDLTAMRQKQEFLFDERGSFIIASAGNQRDAAYLATCAGTATPVMPGESQPSPFLQTIAVTILKHYRDNRAPSTTSAAGSVGPILNIEVRLLTFAVKRPIQTAPPAPPANARPSA